MSNNGANDNNLPNPNSNLNRNAAIFLGTGQLGSLGVNDRKNYLNNAFGAQGKSLDPSYTNVTLPGRPKTPNLNGNLNKRSHYSERNIIPSSYIKINPVTPNPFSASLQINKDHKGIVYGSKPENILNRFKYQKDFFAKELEGKQYNMKHKNLEIAKTGANLQQEINSANSLTNIYKREANEASRRAKEAANRSVSTKAARNIRMNKLKPNQTLKRNTVLPMKPSDPKPSGLRPSGPKPSGLRPSGPKPLSLKQSMAARRRKTRRN